MEKYDQSVEANSISISYNEFVIYQKCIEASSAAAVACLRCAKQLREGFKDGQNIENLDSFSELLFACSSICLLNLKSLASESELSIDVCNNCEEMGVKCEKECEKYGQFDYCKTTAIACGNCAMECKIITEM